MGVRVVVGVGRCVRGCGCGMVSGWVRGHTGVDKADTHRVRVREGVEVDPDRDPPLHDEPPGCLHCVLLWVFTSQICILEKRPQKKNKIIVSNTGWKMRLGKKAH